MKDFKRVVSLLLVFVLLLGVLPANALALGFDDAQQALAEAPMAGLGAPPVAVETPTEETTQETIATEAVEETTEATEATDAATETIEATEEVTEATEETTEATEETTEETTEATEETLPEDALLTMEGIPMAFAADGTTYVLAGSDFQPTDYKNDTGVSLLNRILAQIKPDYSTMNGFLFMGDYDYGYTAATAGKKALQGAIKQAYPSITHEVYVEGNHDSDARQGANLVANGTLSPAGANDSDAYGVYVIHESDYMWHNDDETIIKKTASDLKTYLNAKRNAEYTKPIFVVSHLPLHYCMRTNIDGDGKYANYIFDVLNEAGNAGLNIIFMFGHNHSNGWDDYLGGAAVYLAKGGKINIAQSSKTVFKEETLAFTYLNAGYVSYYRDVNTGSETDLTMTVFEITDNEVKVNRYSAGGLHYMKSAGVTNSYKNESGYSPNTTVYTSPQTITLNKEIIPAGEEVEIPDGGGTGTGTAISIEQVTTLEQGVPYIIVCDRSGLVLTGKSTTNSKNANSLLLNGTPSVDTTDLWYYDGTHLIYRDPNSTNAYLLMSTDTAYLGETHDYRMVDDVYLNNDGATFTLKRTNKGLCLNQYGGGNSTAAAPYEADGNADAGSKWRIYKVITGSGGSTVTPSGGNWVTITEPSEGKTRYVYELDEDGVDTGVEYLIVANSYEKALSAAASSNNAVNIEISGNNAYADSDAYGWTFTRYGSGVYYIRLNNTTYLALSNKRIGTSNSGDSSCRWTVTSNNDGSYDIVRNNYNLRWSKRNGVFQVSNSSEGPVRLYKYVKTETTQTVSGLYGKISGNLTYEVAKGTSAADALAAVKAGIEIIYHTGDEANAQVFPDDGEGMTWTLDESYDGTIPGEYAVTIAYNGVTLGVAKVVVPEVAISGYTIDPMSSTVRQGAVQSVITNSKITVTLEDDNYYTVPVTISMLSKNGEAISTDEPGTYSGLTVTYNGVVITDEYTLHIAEKTINNYPEYPDEGAVKVSKSGTGIDFQSSGIARVELSASGIPAQKGADVVVVIDTSSSMDKDISGHTPSNGEKSRIDILSESLEDMLLTFQKQQNGIYPDIDIAIIDFNGYANKIDGASLNDSYRNNEDLAAVYTGITNAQGFELISNVTLSAGHFVDNLSIDAAGMAGKFDESRTSSGTNYDSGLDNAYKLLSAKKAANGEEERDQYVIFLSDGAPFRYNGYENGSGSGYDNWDKWLDGYWANQEALETAIPKTNNANAYPYFYNGNGTNHPHRIADAIKGEEGTLHQVVVNTAADADPAYMQAYQGLGAKIYAIGFGLAEDGDSTKGYVTVPTMQNILQTIATDSSFYHDVDSAEELTTAFSQIATAINYAATNARFVDQMGDDYNLQLKTATYEVKENDTTVAKTLAPVIEILSYDIYTRDEYLAGACTLDQIGDRKGTYTMLETVRFSADGSKAYSDKMDVDGDKISGYTVDENGNYVFDEGDNILGANGVINAKNFMYNTGTLETTVNGIALASEQFYWKMGTVQTSELAMRYYVYLEGSMEGTRPAGSYPTNESAILYYDNYLGNPCYKETVSPVMAWQGANVSYAFYLVDENGNIIVNQTTGETGTFANKIEVTRPVVYKEIYLNNQDQVASLDVAAKSKDVLPKYYTLYDNAAVYEVTIKSNSTGSWKITKGNDVKASTTYVTQYKTDDASAYSNALTNNSVGDDYTHTVVWFAVVWSVQAHPDTVVIDYGLPVDISVLTNDMFGDYGKLAAIGAYSNTLNLDGHDTTLADGFGATWQGVYGAAEANVDTGKVRYTIGGQIDEENKITQVPGIMKMDGYEKFAYAVSYNGASNAGYYYDTITVIPATTIYYEDSFLTLSGSNTNWVEEGTYDGTGVQDEDRPGEYSLTDANNIYGYDGVNLGMSTYSLGTAKKVHVDADSYAKANFTFAGTGFDVISMTSNTTGTLGVKVYKAGAKQVKENVVKSLAVDTYYGYNYDGNDWVATPDVENALYQVPVIQIEDLPYGVYDVVITATYAEIFDHTSKPEGYDLYLDAIRIYDPANDGAGDKVIEDAYKADGEGWPSYIELRNKIIEANTFGNIGTDNEIIEGVVFIDGDPEVGNAQIEDYKSYGPNNEVYLAPDQYVAFMLGAPANAEIANVHIGIKSADGALGTYTITNISSQDTDKLKKGDYYGARTATINTTTDMYYDLTDWKNDIIVISNTGDNYGTTGLISLTNIKFTYKSNPQATQNMSAAADEPAVAAVAVEMPMNNGEAYLYMTPAAANVAVHAINQEAEKDEDKDDPDKEDDLPIIPIPGVTEPEESIPETTEPEVSVPETTVPETTVPDEEEPEEFDPFVYATLSSKSVKVGNSVLVTVTTDNNVTALSINGKAVTRYTDNLWSGKRIWVDSVKANKIGEMPIEVLAYSAEGEAAEPVIKTVNVTKKSTSIIDAFFGWLFK